MLVNTPLATTDDTMSLAIIMIDAKMKHTVSLSIFLNVSGLNTLGNILDNVSTQLNRVYDKGQVIFRHCNAHILCLLSKHTKREREREILLSKAFYTVND